MKYYEWELRLGEKLCLGTMGCGLNVNYLVRSMFTMYIFVAISVCYIVLVVMQMIIFYINLRCFD